MSIKIKAIKAFLTGSRIYGFPKKSSDIDLVVFMDNTTINILKNHADEADDMGDQYADRDAWSLRFGKLNLLAVTSMTAYTQWLNGTKELIKLKPVDRKFACEVMQLIRSCGLDAATAVKQAKGPPSPDIPF